MVEERCKPWQSHTAAILLTLIALAALPLVLIAIAVLEGKAFGTMYLIDIGQRIGIYEPLESLHDALEPILGW